MLRLHNSRQYFVVQFIGIYSLLLLQLYADSLMRISKCWYCLCKLEMKLSARGETVTTILVRT